MQEVAKIESFLLGTGYSCTNLLVKNSLKIALSLMVFDMFTLFILHETPRWPPKVAKIEIFPLATGHSCTALQCVIFPFINIFSIFG